MIVQKYSIKQYNRKDHDTNDVAIVCKFKIQTLYDQKGKQRQTTSVQQKAQHKTDIRQNNKQQATTTLIVCNNMQRLRHEVQTLKTWRCKQYCRNQNDTNDLVLDCKLTIQTSYWREGKQRQTTFVQQNHKTRQHIWQKNKQQTTSKTLYVISYKQRDKTHNTNTQKLRTNICAE